MSKPRLTDWANELPDLDRKLVFLLMSYAFVLREVDSIEEKINWTKDILKNIKATLQDVESK